MEVEPTLGVYVTHKAPPHAWSRPQGYRRSRGTQRAWPRGLGKDGNSKESFPAKAGGLGVPPGCKCLKRETVGVGWASSPALTDEAGQLQGLTPGGFESSGSSRSGSDPLQETGKLSPVKPSNCHCGDLGLHPGCPNSLTVALAPFPN